MVLNYEMHLINISECMSGLTCIQVSTLNRFQVIIFYETLKQIDNLPIACTDKLN